MCFLRDRNYKNLTGIDISPEQIGISKQVIDDVIEMDALDFLKGSKNKYDLIIALDFIEHLDKNEVLDFLNSCYQALTSEGYIILQTPNGQSPFGSSVFCGDFTHMTCFTPESLQRILTFCGFKNVQTRQTGPVIHGFVSAVRYVIWKILSLMIKLWDLIEVGECKNSVFTRTFLILADKGG